MRQVFAALALTLGCAEMAVQTAGSPGEAGASIRTLAVAPILNRSDTEIAGSVVRNLIIQQLQQLEGIVIVELPPDIVIDPARLDRTRAQEIATKLNVDAMVTGTVFAYGYTEGTPTGGSSPLVSLDLRLVHAATGAIIWAARGTSNHPLVFTKDSRPITELTDELIQKLADELWASL